MLPFTALWLAVAPPPPPPDSPGGLTEHDPWALLIFAVIMAAVAWYLWRRQVRRTKHFESFARERGWDYHPQGDDVTNEPFGRLPLFHKSHQMKMTPMVTGQSGNSRVLLGDYAFVGFTRFYMFFVLGERYHQTIALARSAHQQLPLFVVAPARKSVVQRYSRQNFMRMGFKNRPEGEIFRGEAVMLTRKPELIRELFAGERLNDFIETIVKPLLESRLVLEAGGSWVLVYEANGMAKPEEFPWMCEFAQKTAAYFQPDMADTPGA